MTLPVALGRRLAVADHMDALSIESDAELQPFVARMLSFQPGWLQGLYRVRVLLLRVVGHKTGVPQRQPIAEIPVQMGEKAAFFTVEDSGPQHWMAGASESHLSAQLAVLQSAGQRRRYRYRVVTVVQYHNLLGRLYFALIQPFHYVVVRAMLKHAAQP